MGSVINSKADDNHSPVKRVTFFRFYAELNDHLPAEYRKKAFPYEFNGKPSLKNSIHAIGIPHGEVDLIIVNGTSVNFNYQLHGGEFVSVYPVFESLDITPVIHLRSKPLRETRFIVDVNLGKLALKLRLLGFDTLFSNSFKDHEIISVSLKEKRIVLTRDRGILKQNSVTHGYWLRSDNPKQQLREVVLRFQLQNSFKPFSRCTHCNSQLIKTEKSLLIGILPVDTLSYYNQFWECHGCGRIYWKGSHFKHILNWIEKLKDAQ
ncbi:MAG: Mut7-C RNAse domain-containing protein [Prolixibacteraceae bacterium]|jgi:uncharacterized protein with PIN domain|nr:Mut7-C RNAse domain-containing protein [Prolixibacteraceae bacterium]NLO02090.1 Mut7-C ubiquitin/RNAse domain-containing protein [Bacteroidales bacterium]